MAKIIPENSQADMAKSVHGRIASKGYDEQWQRIYEQAHLERQVAAMDAATDNDPREAQALRRQVTLDSGGGMSSSTASYLHEAPAAPVAAKFSTDMKTAVGRQEQSPVPMTASAEAKHLTDRGATSSNMLRQAASPRPAVVAASRAVAQTVRHALPLASSVTILASGGGMHVVIRDSALSDTDVKRHIAKIRGLMQLHGQTLAAVTLNGTCLWQQASSNGPDGPEAFVDNEPEINRLF